MVQVTLPASVQALVEMAPFEDVGLAVLKDAFPDVTVVSLIPSDAFTQESLLFLVRRVGGWGLWDGDARFMDSGSLSLQVFASGSDADERAALASEAIRVAMREAWREPKYYPGVGALVRVRVREEPVAKADWATSSGPVQYADLPKGWTRYETIYDLRVRRPLASWDARFPL